eukprot:TRINITY_DN10356_c4_g2_i1.p1 TRINITY_DN10356_c4_g2~~TRINITY_DN10356_c4_g2_i1.p1  ORF type:complete len:109 (-),score=15.82 TRINITY_DN10356_c4_g2_i1:353-679(-)
MLSSVMEHMGNSYVFILGFFRPGKLPGMSRAPHRARVTTRPDHTTSREEVRNGPPEEQRVAPVGQGQLYAAVVAPVGQGQLYAAVVAPVGQGQLCAAVNPRSWMLEGQ